jgi:hypothetical protein
MIQELRMDLGRILGKWKQMPHRVDRIKETSVSRLLPGKQIGIAHGSYNRMWWAKVHDSGS